VPADRFRIGFGRKDLDLGLIAMDAHIAGKISSNRNSSLV
jgi:hypothetical protein